MRPIAQRVQIDLHLGGASSARCCSPLAALIPMTSIYFLASPRQSMTATTFRNLQASKVSQFRGQRSAPLPSWSNLPPSKLHLKGAVGGNKGGLRGQ